MYCGEARLRIDHLLLTIGRLWTHCFPRWMSLQAMFCLTSMASYCAILRCYRYKTSVARICFSVSLVLPGAITPPATSLHTEPSVQHPSLGMLRRIRAIPHHNKHERNDARLSLQALLDMKYLGWHVCRTKLARKMFFEARNFSQKMLQNVPRNF